MKVKCLGDVVCVYTVVKCYIPFFDCCLWMHFFLSIFVVFLSYRFNFRMHFHYTSSFSLSNWFVPSHIFWWFESDRPGLCLHSDRLCDVSVHKNKTDNVLSIVISSCNKPNFRRFTENKVKHSHSHRRTFAQTIIEKGRIKSQKNRFSRFIWPNAVQCGQESKQNDR